MNFWRVFGSSLWTSSSSVQVFAFHWAILKPFFRRNVPEYVYEYLNDYYFI